jgi:hypothetical protein
MDIQKKTIEKIKFILNPSTILGTIILGLIIYWISSVIMPNNSAEKEDIEKSIENVDLISNEIIKNTTQNTDIILNKLEEFDRSNEKNINSDNYYESYKFFPVKKGDFWIYDLAYKYTEMNSTNVVEGQEKIKVKVINVYRNNMFLIAELSSDILYARNILDNLENSYGFLYFKDLIFYVENIDYLIKINNNEILKLLNNKEPLFAVPLFDNQTYGYNMDLFRSDTAYMYSVKEFEEEFYINSKNQKVNSFQIDYHTLPDISRIIFSSEIGILSREYYHRGTVHEIDLELIEYGSEY